MAIFRRYSETQACSVSTINFTRKNPINTSPLLGAIAVATVIATVIANAIATVIATVIASTISLSTQGIICIPKYKIVRLFNDNHDIHLLSLCLC